MKRVETSYLNPEEKSPVKCLLWGMFWGAFIGLPIAVADYIRPIFNAIVWGA